MNQFYLWAFALIWVTMINAQTPIPLYKGAAPGSEEWDWEEKSTTSPGPPHQDSDLA